MTATDTISGLRISEPLPAGYYYTTPAYEGFNALPGTEVEVTYSDSETPRRLKLIPVESHTWKDGCRHAVGVIRCHHLGSHSGSQVLSCPHDCAGSEVLHVGHWE